MYYVLAENIALRGFEKIPYAAYYYGQEQLHILSKSEFALLSKCDGETDLPKSAVLDLLCESGFCKVATQGERITDWQKPRIANNRYFVRAFWAITGHCNYNCKHCYMAADNSPLMSEFSLEQSITMLDQFEKCGIQEVKFTGGEPMMHPHFMTILEECAKRRIIIEKIITNGSYITHDKLEKIVAMGHYPIFEISFDGIGHHDWMRGKQGAEEETLAAIKLCRKMDLPVWVNMNIHKGNIDTVLPTIRLMDELGVRYIRIVRTSEAPRWAENGKGLCIDLLAYYDLALDIVKQCISKSYAIDIKIWRFVDFNCKEKWYYLVPAGSPADCYSDNASPCPVVRQMISITPEGDMVPCNPVSGQMKAEGIYLGNVHETPLQSLLHDSAYLDYVTMTTKELQDKNEKCQTCIWWKRCRGGCRACALIMARSLNGPDLAKCYYFENGYLEKTKAVFNEACFRLIND